MVNAAEAQQLLDELHDQLTNLDDDQDEYNHDKDDDGTLILNSAFHPYNVPKNNSKLIPLYSTTITLTANNTKYRTTQKTKIRINEPLTVPALVTPELSTGLVPIHEVTKRVGPVIFTARKAYILNRKKDKSDGNLTKPVLQDRQ